MPGAGICAWCELDSNPGGKLHYFFPVGVWEVEDLRSSDGAKGGSTCSPVVAWGTHVVLQETPFHSSELHVPSLSQSTAVVS